jgi:hypothetical protein
VTATLATSLTSLGFSPTFFTEELYAVPLEKRKRKSPKGQNHPTVDRKPLQCHLQTWCSNAHTLDPLCTVRPPSFILDDKSLIKLSTLHADKVTCVLDIVQALD